MARYMVRFRFKGLEGAQKGLQEPSKGLESAAMRAAGDVKDTGSAYRELVRKLVESLGGRMEAFYYSFGEYDGLAILELPDNTAMTAAAIALQGKGTLVTETVVLITPEEVNKALTLSVG